MDRKNRDYYVLTFRPSDYKYDPVQYMVNNYLKEEMQIKNWGKHCVKVVWKPFWNNGYALIGCRKDLSEEVIEQLESVSGVKVQKYTKELEQLFISAYKDLAKCTTYPHDNDVVNIVRNILS